MYCHRIKSLSVTSGSKQVHGKSCIIDRCHLLVSSRREAATRFISLADRWQEFREQKDVSRTLVTLSLFRLPFGCLQSSEPRPQVLLLSDGSSMAPFKNTYILMIDRQNNRRNDTTINQ